MDRVGCDRGVCVAAVALGVRRLVRPLRSDVLLIALVAAVALSTVCAAPARAGWSAPAAISSAGDIGWMQFAADAGGDEIAVWGRLTGPANPVSGIRAYAVEVAFRPAGSAWQLPVIVGAAYVACDRGGCEHFPAVTLGIGLRGEAVVMWSSAVSGVSVTEAALRTAGGRWQRPIVICWACASLQGQVAVDRRGNATAIVLGSTSTGLAVRVAFKPAGRAWRRPVTIGTGNGYGVQLALDAEGDAIAVWRHTLGHGRLELVQSAFRPVGGSWRRPVTIGHLGDGTAAQVAVDPRGDAIVVWAGWTRPNRCCMTAVRAVFKPAGGRWRRPVTLAHNEGTSGVRVAFGRHGKATAVWSVNAAGVPAPFIAVQSASRPAGGSWGGPVTIASPGSRIESLRLALDPRGDALAVWWVTPAPEIPSDMQAAITSPRGIWQPPISLGGGPSPLTGFDVAAGAALDSQGNAVAVWLHDLGNDQQVLDAATFIRAG